MFVRGILQEKKKTKNPQLHWWCNGKRAPLECRRRWKVGSSHAQVEPKAQNQDNVSEWIDMCTLGLLF